MKSTNSIFDLAVILHSADARQVVGDGKPVAVFEIPLYRLSFVRVQQFRGNLVLTVMGNLPRARMKKAIAKKKKKNQYHYIPIEDTKCYTFTNISLHYVAYNYSVVSVTQAFRDGSQRPRKVRNWGIHLFCRLFDKVRAVQEN
jgi:hypothetical protein